MFNKGISLIEIVVSAGIISVSVLTLIGVTNLAFQGINESLLRDQASFLAEEGIEAVKTIRDRGWLANIASITPDINYYLNFQSNAWQISTNPAGQIDNFTRRIIFSNVYRDGSDNIALSGTLDNNTKKITVFVSWLARNNQTKSISASTYITNFLQN